MKSHRKILLCTKGILLLLFFCKPGNAQTDSLHRSPLHPDSDRYLAVELQYNGFLKPYTELCIGQYTSGISGHEPKSSGIFIGSELKIDFNRTVIGPKVSLWFSGGCAAMTMGINIIYYTDIKSINEGSIRIRPELGLGLDNFRGFVGFNIPLTHYKSSKDFVGILNAGIVWAIPLIQFHSAEYYL